jgi:hypothetical protein
MPSELKSATSRANGAKSRGPKTPEGRERSSQNSLRHGIVARKTILLECEDPNQFQDMLEEFAETYQPGNAVEQDLVDEMLSSRWRSGRLSMIVTSLLDMQMNQQRLQIAPPTTARPDPARPIATAFKSLADESKALALALRYETRLRRIFERAFDTLRDLQRERKMESAKSESVVSIAGPDTNSPANPDTSSTTNPEAKPGVGVEPARPEAVPAAHSTPRPARCARKKMERSEPDIRYALPKFRWPRRENAQPASSEARQ